MTLLADIDGVPVRLRRSPRARRMSLKVDPADGTVTLVMPPQIPAGAGIAFARSQAGWLAARLAAVPPAVPFAPGALVPFLGQPHRLCHVPDGRGGVWVDNGSIAVSGRPEHLARRVGDWLQGQARRRIVATATPMAAKIGAAIGRIRLGDPRSRWGSCNSKATLAFSWRLILAPGDVLTYVVAHEVAHLREMNHSAAFWRLVDQLAPGWDPARRWLKANGALLHRFG